MSGPPGAPRSPLRRRPWRSGRRSLPLIALALLAYAAPAGAVTAFASRAGYEISVGSDPLLTPAGEDWDTLAAGATIPDGVAIDGVTYATSDAAQSAVVQQTFVHPSHPNGLGETPDNLFSSPDAITFSFAVPIRAFGIDVATFATNDGAYTATTNEGDVVTSVFDPFADIGNGQFVGFVADPGEGPFTSVTVASTGSPYVLDNLRYAVDRPAPPSDLPSFPGAFGHGASTRGALACEDPPVVLTVDTLADDENDGCASGSCTFREAITHPAPAFVNFNVAGVIVIDGFLRLQEEASCKTISGATAPGDGVTIANETLNIENGFHDLILRYLRIRPGLWPEVRGEFAGCNDWDYRCDPDPDQDCNTIPCRCSPHERGEYQAECDTCAPWSPAAPNDFSQCNDSILTAGGILCAISVIDEASDLIFDHLSMTWSLDETFGVSSQRNSGGVSVLNSIIGWGHKGVDPELPAANREMNDNYGILFGGHQTTPAGAKTVTGWTFARNFIGANRKRAPKHSVGNGVDYVNNVFYNNENVATLSPFKNSVPMRIDFRYNLFRAGPDDLTRFPSGYCASGPDADRACGHDTHCQGGANPCDLQWPYFIKLEANDASRGELFLEGNLFMDEQGQPYSRPFTELDPQWDWVEESAPAGQGWLRPRRIEDADGTTWWDERRLVRSSPRPFADGVPLPPDALPTEVLPQVGASRPSVDPVDAAILATWSAPAPWAGPDFVYPSHAGTPWPDADGDGLDDDWELAHFSHLGRQPLTDSDGDGYLEIEEWMNASDPLQWTWGQLATLFGDALGGQVTVIVAGVPASVTTTPGLDATSLLLALADALEADPTLAAQGGVTASVGPNTLSLDRTIESFVVSDAGLRTRLDPPQLRLPAIGSAGAVALALTLALAGAAAARRRTRSA